MANGNVLFFKATKEKYDALVEKNPLALYFIEDIPALYVGDVLFAIGAEATSESVGLMSPEMRSKLDNMPDSGIVSNEAVEEMISWGSF